MYLPLSDVRPTVICPHCYHQGPLRRVPESVAEQVRCETCWRAYWVHASVEGWVRVEREGENDGTAEAIL